MLHMPLCVKIEDRNFRSFVCATCLSSNRILYSMKNLDQFLNLCNGVVLGPDDNICWECKATFTRMLQFRKRALQSKSVLTWLIQPQKIARTYLVNSLSSLTQKLNNTYDAEFEEHNDIEECADIKVEDATIKLEIEKFEVESENSSEMKVFSMKSKLLDKISDGDTDSTEETPGSAKLTLSALLSKGASSSGIKVCPPPPWESFSKAPNTWRQGCLKDNDKNIENNTDKSNNLMKYTYYDTGKVIHVITKKMDIKEMMEMRHRKENHLNYKSSKFKCVHCLDFFMREYAYIQHMKVHSEEAGPHKCTICHLGFKSKEEMQTHNDSHYIIYACSECDYKNLSRKNMKMHCYTYHRAEFQCRKCDKKFTSKRKLTDHGTRAHRGLKTCPVCNRGFLSQSTLKSHMVTHTNIAKFECNICHKKFRIKKSLQKHVDSVHENRVEPSYCVECDKTFKSEATYIAHLKLTKTHGNPQPMYECADCGRKYPSKFYLEHHMELIHLRRGKHLCTLCNKVLHTARSLKAHMRTAHGKPKKRSLVCHICGKSFTVKKSLQEHVFSHQGLRPYQCKVCDATFSYSAALFTHNRLKHLKMKRRCDISKKRSTNEVAK